VNSYQWNGQDNSINFPELLEMVAKIHPMLRVRFATSHPKDLSDQLIETIVKNKNICRSIHLPVQSGSSRILKLMNRKYDRDWYLERAAAIKRSLPDCSITTDIISGFCSETEEDHKETLELMKTVKFDYAYMFQYSERPGTIAARKMKDDVPAEVKSRRLQEIIALQQKLSHKSNLDDVGKTFEVLAEGTSKRSGKEIMGRNSQNKVVVFPGQAASAGEYFHVKINDCTAATLKGQIMHE
jgi:tRNA-2-methylthio-N6-dimethylallyladenosine synthase